MKIQKVGVQLSCVFLVRRAKELDVSWWRELEWQLRRQSFVCVCVLGLVCSGDVRSIGGGSPGMRMSTFGLERDGRGGEMLNVVAGLVVCAEDGQVCVVDAVSSGSVSMKESSIANLLEVGIVVSGLECAREVDIGFRKVDVVSEALVQSVSLAVDPEG